MLDVVVDSIEIVVVVESLFVVVVVGITVSISIAVLGVSIAILVVSVAIFGVFVLSISISVAIFSLSKCEKLIQDSPQAICNNHLNIIIRRIFLRVSDLKGDIREHLRFLALSQILNHFDFDDAGNRFTLLENDFRFEPVREIDRQAKIFDRRLHHEMLNELQHEQSAVGGVRLLRTLKIPMIVKILKYSGIFPSHLRRVCSNIGIFQWKV
jgi:hypothetical protein